MLDLIQDSSEILEIIKLSKLYKLEGLFKAAEAYFQEIMFLWFENHSVFTLKPNVIASLNGMANVNKRNAQLIGKNKVEGTGDNASAAQNVALIQGNSQRGVNGNADSN